MGYTADCVPKRNKKGETTHVVIKITATEGDALGVMEMVKVLAGFLKHTIEENKIDFADVAWKSTDKVAKL